MDNLLISSKNHDERIMALYAKAVEAKLTVLSLVDIETTQNVNLVDISEGVIDNYVLKEGTRIVIKDQLNPVENGIYQYIPPSSSSGTLTGTLQRTDDLPSLTSIASST